MKHPQRLIAFNFKSVKSNSTIVHVRMCCGFVCDAVDLFKSQVLIHTLVLSTFYFTISICNIYYGVVETMNFNKGGFVSVMWIMLTS